MLKFNEIKTRNHLADYLGIPRSKLTHILYIEKVENMYVSFEIPKKCGGTRVINAPQKDLKSIQRKLAEAIYDFYYNDLNYRKQNNSISHAFEKGKSIITNAEVHRNKRFVYNVDIESFFDSFHFGRVKGFFEKNKDFLLPEQVALTIAQLSCFNGRLPQGAPTSPVITNIICKILDMRLVRIAKKYRLDYTRYADDLTFSTNDKKFQENKRTFLNELIYVIECSGFKLNDKKTRLIYQDSRQEVTGLVVNHKVNVQRKYFKITRAMADSLYRTGSFKIEGKEGSINQLEGRFSFINQLDKYNNVKNNKMNKKSSNYSLLNSREKQYRQFLFYKYFFANEKLLVITEGKTDIVYLKCALKKYCDKYPKLIKQNDDGNFRFNISFLNRTKRLKFFFDIQQDGADTLKNIYDAFTGKDKKTNYLELFKNKGNRFPDNPVVLAFDNEMKSKKPLKKFVDHAKLNDEKQAKIQSELYVNIVDNLYLITNPLMEGKKECEIEDLFDKETLDHMINGKKFSREENIDLETCFGKAAFAKYVASDYININFKNFLPILDVLNSIITDYEEKKRIWESKNNDII